MGLIYLFVVMSLFLPFILALGTLNVTSQVVVRLPVENITLPCHYHPSNRKAVRSFMWEYEKKDGPLVVEKNSINTINYGSGYENNIKLGNDCSMVIHNLTTRHSGLYVVTIQFDDPEESAEVELFVFNNSAVMYGNVISTTQQPCKEVSLCKCCTGLYIAISFVCLLLIGIGYLQKSNVAKCFKGLRLPHRSRKIEFTEQSQPLEDVKSQDGKDIQESRNGQKKQKSGGTRKRNKNRYNTHP